MSTHFTISRTGSAVGIALACVALTAPAQARPIEPGGEQKVVIGQVWPPASSISAPTVPVAPDAQAGRIRDELDALRTGSTAWELQLARATLWAHSRAVHAALVDLSS